jgi:hypothetical protein
MYLLPCCPVISASRVRCVQSLLRHSRQREKTMQTIPLFSVSNIAHLVQLEEFHELTIESPALEIFTDFKKHIPLTIEGSVPAVDVENLMRKAHVKMKLVVDTSNEFIGTISLEDLDEQHFMMKIAAGYARQDIQVSDLMTPKERIPSFVDIFSSVRRPAA